MNKTIYGSWPFTIVPYPKERVMPKELPKYQSFKIVHALQIEKIEDRIQTHGDVILHFVDEGFDPVTIPAVVVARFFPHPKDYYVVYDNIDQTTKKDYVAISPRDVFEGGYARIFGDAHMVTQKE